jgi:hypothetical protein
MTQNATGLAQAIRAYVAANPLCRVRAIAKAIGYPVLQVGHEARRMTERGTLKRTGSRQQTYYSLGRPPIVADPETVKANARKREAAYRERHREQIREKQRMKQGFGKPKGRPKRVYTEAEQLERLELRRAQKRESDRKRTAQKTENARKRRAAKAAQGLTCPGMPKLPRPVKVIPKRDPRQVLRALIADSINNAKERPVAVQRVETIEEWQLRTGCQPERLPCTFVPPSAYPRFAGVTRAVAGSLGHSP